MIEADSLVFVVQPVGSFQTGEMARVIERNNTEAFVFGLESHQYGHLPISSMVAVEDVNSTHDYVYTEDDDANT